MQNSLTNRLAPFVGNPALLRAVAIAALVAVFGQVTFGSIVRVSESGLGCPDWPLCHGQVIPPFEFETLIEYTHRLIGTLVGLLVVATAALAWLGRRQDRLAVNLAAACVALVVTAGVLGGVTVLTELEWWWRLVHLGVAEILAACLTALIVGCWLTWPASQRGQSVVDVRPRLGRMMIAALGGVFLLMLSGSYMVGEGAGSSCATWPLCRGDIFPSGEPYLIHMTHRYIAALIGVHVLATSYILWKRREEWPVVGRWAAVMGVGFVVQVLLGAVLVEVGFEDIWKVVHLSMATLSWISLVLVAALIYLPGGATSPATTPQGSSA